MTEETCQTHTRTHTPSHTDTVYIATQLAQYTAISALSAVSIRRLSINLARLVHTRLCRPRHVRTSAILSLLARPKILYTALSIQASSRQALVAYQAKSQPQINTVRKVDNMTSLAQL